MLRKQIAMVFSLAFALVASLGMDVGASAKDWVDKDDDIIYLTSVEPNADEYFIVEFEYDHDGDVDDVLITYYHQEGSGHVKDTKKYDADELDSIHFVGDEDLDGFYNYTDLPSVAYGGGGTDYLVGGDSTDEFFGEEGKDFLYGNGGNDKLDAGEDFVEGTVDGGEGEDSATLGWWISNSSNRGFKIQDFDNWNSIEVVNWFNMAPPFTFASSRRR